MGKLWSVVQVLYVGKSLANPAKWKNLQVVMNGGLLTVLLSLDKLAPVGLQLSDADVYQVAEAIGVIGVMINTYLINATSDKVGFRPSSK